MKNNSPVICVGAGKNQLPLIRASYDMGLDVFSIDRAPIDSCKSLCSYTVNCSTYDSGKAIQELRIALKNKQPKGLIFRTSGPAVLTAALICEEFQLNNLSLNLAKASVQKSVLSQDCKDLGILTPKSNIVSNFDDFRNDYFGKVIKPDIPVIGTKNVFRLINEEQARDSFQKAKEESVNNLVETQEYIYGLDMVVMVICSDNKRIEHLNIDQWVTLLDGRFEKVGAAIPSILEGHEVTTKILKIIDRLIFYWKIVSGIIFFTFRVDQNGNAWLYEVNPGIIGDKIVDDLLPMAFGNSLPNLFEIDVKLMLGEMIDSLDKVPQSYAILEGKVISMSDAISKLNVSTKYKELMERINLF